MMCVASDNRMPAMAVPAHTSAHTRLSPRSLVACNACDPYTYLFEPCVRRKYESCQTNHIPVGLK